MKRSILITGALLVVLSVAFLFFMRHSVVVREGYPRWKAVGNKLVYDGSIVVILPHGVNVISAECDDPES